MTFFGPDLRNGLPIGLGSVAGFGIAPQFSPASLFLGGTVNGAWYDPSDSTTLFSDRAGTTPCGTPGGGSVVPVGRMLDKSGNGNHATAANDTTARPELRARVNLLTYSEDFSNAAWAKTRSSVTANATTAPDGTVTADKLVEDTTATSSHLTQSSTISSPPASPIFSIYLKAAERNWAALQLNGDVSGFAYFDLTSGVIGTVSNVTASIASIGNGWYRCSVTRSGFTTSAFGQVFLATGDNTASYTGNGTSGIFIWGAQLTATNEFPANTYQRIVDANTYDAVGFPRYLACNGTSSAMSTPGNVNLSGTDKATVFAGVRPQVGTTQIIAELSTDASAPANNGTFYFIVSGSRTFFGSKGTTFQDRGSNAQTFPVSYVATGAGNISAPSASIRVNGALEGTNTSSQGTGNYSSYPLFIGARNNSSLFFNGNLYSLIVVGSAVSAGQISATEQWVAQRTGITI